MPLSRDQMCECRAASTRAQEHNRRTGRYYLGYEMCRCGGLRAKSAGERTEVVRADRASTEQEFFRGRGEGKVPRSVLRQEEDPKPNGEFGHVEFDPRR